MLLLMNYGKLAELDIIIIISGRKVENYEA
jgi:hypothetical protein